MKKRWFTLIEMLIVIVIIGVLAWALIPRIGSARDKANDTARESNVRSLATAMVSYWLDHGSYPADSGSTISGNILEKYSIPSWNFANQPTSWQVYNYNDLDAWAHFVVYTDLSAGSEAWNCSWWQVKSYATDTNSWKYSVIQGIIWTTWASFCYLQ